MVLNSGLSYGYFRIKQPILCNWTMQPLRQFFKISFVTWFFSQHFFKTKPFPPKTFAFENRWKNRALKSKTPQFWWLILESAAGIWGRKAVQSVRCECHLPVALRTPGWATLSSVSQHCYLLLQLGQQPWPLHIYCQAVTLAWFAFFSFLHWFGFISSFHCLGFLTYCFSRK